MMGSDIDNPLSPIEIARPGGDILAFAAICHLGRESDLTEKGQKVDHTTPHMSFFRELTEKGVRRGNIIVYLLNKDERKRNGSVTNVHIAFLIPNVPRNACIPGDNDPRIKRSKASSGS